MFAKRLLIISSLSLCILGARAEGLPEYLRIYASDPYSRAELRNKCSVCHINPAGGGPHNDFGKAFIAAGHRITPEMRKSFTSLFHARGEEQAPMPNVTFLQGSQSEAVIEIDGRRYLINTREQTVSLLASEPSASVTPPKVEPQPDRPGIYHPNDVRLINLPTAMPIEKGALWMDFTHRFPFNEVDDHEGLFGLDGFAVPSFGVTYGLTDRLHIGAYRSPTIVGRPIEVFLGASLLEERKGHPFNLQGRVAIEGRDNFQRNFTTSFELTFARSVTRHAQFVVVPTVSLGDRPLVSPERNFEGRTAAALGVGLAVNVQPSLTLMAEANMRLNEHGRYIDGRPEFGFGIRRPVIGFGIMKASISRKHAFSLTFSNGPGTTLAQRSMTRGLIFNDDSLNGLTIGFNLTRRLF